METDMVKFNPVHTNQQPAKEKLLQRLWESARMLLWRPTPWFAHGWRRFWVKFFSSLGGGKGISRMACFMSRARVDYPWNVTIGHSSVDNGAWVYALAKITIGDNVCIGEDVRLLTGTHDLGSATFDLVIKPIDIGDNVWIATGAIILPGVKIGEGAVVAAGAVVTKDVKPWTVVGGNPARFLKNRILVSKECSNV